MSAIVGGLSIGMVQRCQGVPSNMPQILCGRSVAMRSVRLRWKLAVRSGTRCLLITMPSSAATATSSGVACKQSPATLRSVAFPARYIQLQMLEFRGLCSQEPVHVCSELLESPESTRRALSASKESSTMQGEESHAWQSLRC